MRLSINGVRITPGATLKSRTCTQLGFKYCKDTDYYDYHNCYTCTSKDFTFNSELVSLLTASYVLNTANCCALILSLN